MEGGYDGVLCGGYGFDSRDEGIETEALYGGKCAGKEGKETGPRTNAITCAGIDPRKMLIGRGYRWEMRLPEPVYPIARPNNTNVSRSTKEIQHQPGYTSTKHKALRTSEEWACSDAESL